MSKKTAECFLSNPTLFPKDNGVHADQERLLPTPAIDNFNGDPMKYQIFVRQFGAYIAKRSYSNEVRLLVL